MLFKQVYTNILKGTCYIFLSVLQWRQRQQVSQGCCWITTKLHNVISQKAVNFIGSISQYWSCFISVLLCWYCIYSISRPIKRTFFPEKCDLNSTCVLCAEGKYHFQTYKYPHPHRVKTTMKMNLVAVTTIFWVSMMNKLYYGC